MPKVYDCMVRMNDEDIRKEYITQMEIILNDDPNVGERVKGIAEGMSIKLGEMMDMLRSLLEMVSALWHCRPHCWRAGSK